MSCLCPIPVLEEDGDQPPLPGYGLVYQIPHPQRSSSLCHHCWTAVKIRWSGCCVALMDQDGPVQCMLHIKQTGVFFWMIWLKKNLDCMFLTETWQHHDSFIHLKDLCDSDWAIIATPLLGGHGGGLAVSESVKLACFSSFELQISRKVPWLPFTVFNLPSTWPGWCLLIGILWHFIVYY